jgi:hypothetical protein
MNRGWLVILTGCLILGFQNCSQTNLSASELASSSAHLVTPAVGTGSDADSSAPISSLEIPLTMGSLSVDPVSGRIVFLGANDQVIDEYCLPAQEISELQSYLKVSNICGPKNAVDAGAQCGQVYTPAYASLGIGDQKMNLGESYDSCGRGFKDICGEQAAQSFRGLVAYIQKNFKSLSCE